MRYQITRPRLIIFRVAYGYNKDIMTLTNWVISHTKEKGLSLLKVKIRDYFNISVIWLWCTRQEKFDFIKDLSEYAEKAIDGIIS